MEKMNLKGTLAAIFVGTMLAIILISLNWKTGAVYEALGRLDLIPKPERFTELYFMNDASLPASSETIGTLTFSFGIRNDEGTTTTYPYSAYLENGAGARTIFSNGSVTLPANSSTVITVTHALEKNETGKVVVDLTSMNDQSIDFLLQPKN